MQDTNANAEGRARLSDIEGVPSSLTADQLELMEKHLEMVLEKNLELNLTRICDWDEALYLHIVDSLTLLDAFEAAPNGAFLDIGTGAGYPGVPLAIATGRKATLVDSSKKKAQAVKDFVEELGIDKRVRVESERVEVLGRAERGRYAVVCARAVAQTGTIVEYAAPLLMKGGRLVVAKARPTDEELEVAKRVADMCGLRFVSRETLELAGERGHREIIVYERYANPRIKLPRKVGQAQHNPLGA